MTMRPEPLPQPSHVGPPCDQSLDARGYGWEFVPLHPSSHVCSPIPSSYTPLPGQQETVLWKPAAWGLERKRMGNLVPPAPIVAHGDVPKQKAELSEEWVPQEEAEHGKREGTLHGVDRNFLGTRISLYLLKRPERGTMGSCPGFAAA